MRRLVAFVAAVLAGVVFTAAPAAADPPGPTDYRSEVTDVDPPTDLGLRFIGGDSFVELDHRGHDVVVVGYRGEPYLWFRDDGRVFENRRSPTRTLNEDRYGDVPLPDSADVDAEPDWEPVASDGIYAWHDHRTHWMNDERPPGAEAGDQVLEGVVPLVVDGAEVDVEVASFLLPSPSPIGWIVAVVVGLLAGAVVWWRLGGRVRAVVATTVAGAGLAAGAVAFSSVPVETGPSVTLWVLPASAVVFSLLALGSTWRSTSGLVATALLGGAGAELLVWAWTRRDALTSALIPSELPSWLDRVVVGGAGAFGAALLVGAAATLLVRERPRAPRPRRP